MLFDTINEQIELGPASVLQASTTASSGNTGYTIVGTGTSWDQFVKPGDLISLALATPDTAHILKVVSATELTIDKSIADNSKGFEILRATEAFIRPYLDWEWELHSIIASQRQFVSAEPMDKWPIEIWSTDDSYPRTLLYTSTATGLSQTSLLLKPTYFNWLLIRNFQKVRMDIAITGIDKTVKHK